MLSPGTLEPLGGRFALEREVGRGGVGVVYRALDLHTGHPVAVKIVAAAAGVAPEDEARLRREGEVLRLLRHPNIVRVIASGFLEREQQPFVAMEWLEGEDLGVRHRRRPLALQEVVALGALVARALGAAHRAGVVHRDIKPGNILLRPLPDAPPEELDVEPVVVDFGVATRMRLGRTGDIVGTPAYMAPEQARGDTVIDGRADLYSLGATLFELVAGRPPHVGPSTLATLARLATTIPPSLRELIHHTPPSLDELVRRLLRTDPAERPETAEEVEGLLREALLECGRTSWIPRELTPRIQGSSSRLLTTLVASRFVSPDARRRALEKLHARSADAAPLGADALVAHLGARRALGDEAAVALDIGHELAAAGAQVGIATGRARVDVDRERDSVQPLGEVVDRAAALARAAAAGSVLVDTTTRELGRGRYGFSMGDAGSALLGAPLPRAQQERSGGAPFLGRETELNQVLGAYDQCLRDSTSMLVSISGPPGIGKSRLQRELLARISARAEPPELIVQRSEGYSRAHALGAAADLLRALVRLPKGASEQEAEDALVDRLGLPSAADSSNSGRLLLAKLLANEALEPAGDARGSRDALWLAMTDLVLRRLDSPLVVVLEDLQWADAESVGWIDHLLGRAAERPLLVLACVRPSFWAEHGERFIGRKHVRVDLHPLARDAVREIAGALLGHRASDEALRQIAEQAAGSPLFAAELARVIAAGRDPKHAPTIEAAIQVSLDALGEESRDALGRLSVFGLCCWEAALPVLGIADPARVLEALAGTDFLVRQSSSRFPGTSEWAFQHALMRDVAYESLGEERRRELHVLAANWLAEAGEDAAIVAAHYDRGDLPELAAHHWERAARRALTANALQDALTLAERALAFSHDKPVAFRRALYLDESWSRLDPRASDRESAVSALEENVYDEASAVRARGARARYDDARGAGENVSERLGEVCDSAEALGLHEEVARCAACLAARHAFAGHFDAAERQATRLLALAESQNVKGAAVDGYQTLAVVRQTQGALIRALDSRRNAVAAARAAGLKEREAVLMTNLGFALTTLGARQEARSALEAGLALAEAIGSAGAVRHARMNLLGWASVFGTDRELDVQLAEVRADADAAAAEIWTAPDRANLGTLFYRGVELLRAPDAPSATRAAQLLRTAATGYRQMGHHDVLPAALGAWAEAERLCHRTDAAVALAREAAELLDGDAPSLLNESIVYLAWQRALSAAGDEEAAREAVVRGLRPLRRRLDGLLGTPYARQFLTELPTNADLIAALERFDALPEDLQELLARAPG